MLQLSEPLLLQLLFCLLLQQTHCGPTTGRTAFRFKGNDLHGHTCRMMWGNKEVFVLGSTCLCFLLTVIKRHSHFPLRSSTSPSAGCSHLSHRNTCVSESDPWLLDSLQTSTLLQCQSRFGNLVWTSSRSRTRIRRPRGLLAWTRTGHTCEHDRKTPSK